MKVQLFTHTDLDGAVSNLLFCRYYIMNGYSISTELCTYGNVDSKIASYLNSYKYNASDVIVITDISPSKEIADKLDSFPNKKILIDHHQTALENLGDENGSLNYSWMLIREGDSAAKLVLKYLLKLTEQDEKQNSVMKQYINLVVLADLWDSKPRNSEEYISNLSDISDINALFSVLGYNNFKARFIINPSIELSEVENAQIAVLVKIKEDACKYTRIISLSSTWEEKKVLYGVGFVTGKFKSDIAEWQFNVNNDLLFVILLDLNIFSGSIRRNGNHPLHESLDLSVLADKIAGGGGHPFAAGFNFELDNYADILDTVLKGSFL